MSNKESVKVVVRCRPFNEKEKTEGHSNIVDIDSKACSISIKNPGASDDIPKTFTFDNSFDEQSKQIDVYNLVARPTVESVLNGYNGTIFAYGQTGTGKTFSMEGVRDEPELRGIIPNSFFHIFDHINKHASNNTKFLVRVSFLEIYNEDIYDLLSKSDTKLELKERPDVGVYVKDLSSFVVKSVEEMEKLMTVGNKNRAVGATLMNARSSRSHSIFSINIETSEIVNDKEQIRMGKLHLVDLAGSERQTKTGAVGERLKEATKINLSLSALGNVISALVDGKSTHIPYRDSKLTRLLQDSLGGNSKTTMIATFSPASYNYEETISTLRYANRAKNIKNKPKINEDPKDALLREYQEQIKRLREQLSQEGGDIMEEEGSVSSDDADEEGEKKTKSTEKRLKKKGDRSSSDVRYAEIEEKRQKILSKKGMIEEEKERLLQEVDRKKELLDKEISERELAKKRLMEMEGKLLVGGVNVLDEAERQALELERKAAELEENKKREEELRKELETHEEVQLQIETEFTSLQEEVTSKTKKMKQLFAFFQSLKSDLEDLKEESQKEREDLLEGIRELTQRLKLKNLIIHSCIPESALEKIEEHAEFIQIGERWRISHIAHAGNNIKGKRSIISGLPIQGFRRSIIEEEKQKISKASKRIASSKKTDIGHKEWMGYSGHPLWQTNTIYLSYLDVIPNAYKSIVVNDQENENKVFNGNGSSTFKSNDRPQTSRRNKLKSAAGNTEHAVGATRTGTAKKMSKEAGKEEQVIPLARGLVSKPKRYA